MLTLTSPVEIWAHRLPAGTKLAALGVTTLGLFALSSPWPVAAAALAVAALYLSGGWQFARVSARLLRPLWPFVVIIAIWHLWQRDLTGGATIILRIITTVAAANLVTMTTRLSDIIAVIAWAARPLAVFGLQPRVLALAVALVIRFIPVMLLRVQTIAESFRARSARRASWRILVPALLAALDDAEFVAEALRARGGTG
jgi:biotin transport system permease protein